MKRHASRRRLFASLALLAGLPLLAVAWLAWHWANQPVASQIQATASPGVALPATQTVTTSLYTFKVPAGFRIRTVTDPAHPDLTHTQAIEPESMGRQVGVTTNSLPDGGLAAVADYNLRVTETDKYSAYNSADMPAGAKAFRDTTSGERTMFLVGDGVYASVTVSGLSGSGRLRTLFSQVYTTWTWL